MYQSHSITCSVWILPVGCRVRYLYPYAAAAMPGFVHTTYYVGYVYRVTTLYSLYSDKGCRVDHRLWGLRRKKQTYFILALTVMNKQSIISALVSTMADLCNNSRIGPNIESSQGLSQHDYIHKAIINNTFKTGIANSAIKWKAKKFNAMN